MLCLIEVYDVPSSSRYPLEFQQQMIEVVHVSRSPDALASAMLDRLLNRANVLNIDGGSDWQRDLEQALSGQTS